MNMDHRAEEMKGESEIGDTQTLLPIHSSLTEASTAFSFDYSVNSSSSSSSSREKYDDGVNIEMITKLTEERDQARDEAREAKLVVSNIMEVVQILTRLKGLELLILRRCKWSQSNLSVHPPN
jgi:hypothetical protein